MKRTNLAYFLFVAFLLLGASANAQTTDFVTVWKTDNPGGSASNQVRIYTGTSFDMNYTVRWGDGTMNTGVKQEITHTYATLGTYTVRISGNFSHIKVGDSGDQLKLLSINQWGTTEWDTFVDAFAGCSNMVLNTTTAPKMGPLTGCDAMFRGCILFNTNISSWDMTNVGSTESMFEGCTAFNQPLNNWNMVQVQFTDYMFKGCTAFNQSLNKWNLAKVRETVGMFEGATSFNSALFSEGLSACVNAAAMFKNATSFNQPIPAWSTVSLQETLSMFEGATAFNQPLSFNMTHVGNMAWMLDNCGMSVANYDATIEFWKNTVTQKSYLGAMGLKYCTAAASRDYLITNRGWTFDGDAPNSSPAIQLTSGNGTSNQSLCVNTTLTNIQYTATNVSGASFTGLPSGVNGSYAAGTGSVLISGMPTVPGTFNFTINTTGTCGGALSATGTITVQAPTVNAGPVLAALCPNTSTPALGGSFGGSATGAIWSDGSSGGPFDGRFTNNTGSTPQKAVYYPSFFATGTIVLRLTTIGGSCGTIYAEKTVVINDAATWLGLTDQWDMPTNWSTGVIPAACTEVTVNSGTAYMPRVTGLNNTCYKLTLNNGATITIDPYATLLITGNY